jgi:hypothetical protein
MVQILRRPPELVVRNTTLPPPVREEIELRVDRLYHFSRRILRCRATLEGPGRHHRQGYFQMRIRMHLPGCEIEVSRRAADEPADAIREAFAAARRSVRAHLERIRGDVKTHETGNRSLG